MGKNDLFHAMRRSLSKGQHEALLRKIWLAGGGEKGGNEAIQALLRDELRVKFIKKSPGIIDGTGRVIPISGMKGVFYADRDCYLTQPEIDYAARLARLQEFYSKDAKFMSAAEFEDRCKAVLKRITSNRKIANLLKGPYFPFVVPQLKGDLGTLLDNTMVPAMRRSCKAQFRRWSFTNYHKGELAGQVTVITGTRQERLIEAMAKGSVCGVYFPAFQGFGTTAARQMIGRLPKNLILSGMEVPVVVTAYPEIIAGDFKTPVLVMAALQWQSDDDSLAFGASDVGGNFLAMGTYPDYRRASGVSIIG